MPLWDRIDALGEQDVEAPCDDTELRIDLERAVGRLPPAYLDAVTLHYFCDLSIAEAAARLGINESACKVRLHRARTPLREQLGTGALARSEDLQEGGNG